MSWIEPKTDWVSSDYFNIGDYNRIIGNLNELKTMSDSLFYPFININDMGSDKNYSSMIYAREINLIETNLDLLNLGSYNFNIGVMTEYQPNGSTPLWNEFNRIESAILLLYNTMKVQKDALNKLSFTLGSQKGVRV